MVEGRGGHHVAVHAGHLDRGADPVVAAGELEIVVLQAKAHKGFGEVGRHRLAVEFLDQVELIHIAAGADLRRPGIGRGWREGDPVL